MMIEKLKSLLTNCRTINQVKQIHALVTTVGATNQLENLLSRQVVLFLTNTRFSRNVSRYIQQLLRSSRSPDASSWGFAVRFFSVNGQFNTAFCLYVNMQRLGLSLSTFAFSSSLKACAKMGHKLGGFSVHSQVHKLGFLSSVYVLTSLLDFYCKTGDMESARKVFDEMPDRNVVSWNSMLAGFLRAGNMDEARRVFDEAPAKDVVSWNSMITGYARTGDMDRAVRLFERMPERDSASWNAVTSGFASLGDMESAWRFFDASATKKNVVSCVAMIAGYSNIGDVVAARSVFDGMERKELFAHNAMIACYEQNSRPREALEVFNDMVKPESNVDPDEKTLTSVISACSQLGYRDFGVWVEGYVKSHGVQMDNRLTNAFVDMYAKCGDIDKAYELFRGLRNKDVVSYSAMILGFGINGKASDAIRVFNEMVDEAGISPNLVTYKGLLTAYSHAGLVEEGLECLSSMRGRGLVPSADHYGIVVGLLGRSGRLEDAHGLIESMPVEPHAGVWGALLQACRLHGCVGLGEVAARKCFGLRPEKTGYPALLAGVYSSAERWDEVGRLRSAAEDKCFAKTTPGCSWISSF